MLSQAMCEIRGEWFDEVTLPCGTRYTTGWRKNQIQNTAGAIICGLLANKAAFGGVQYLAIGNGNVSWDVSPPAQARSATSLSSEFFRKALTVGGTSFRNPADPSEVSADPTRVVQYEFEMLSAEANGTHREFGLFGGNASAAANSGFMLNWVVTLPRIEKVVGMVIRRQVRITYPEL
jgi:hypothetical protein